MAVYFAVRNYDKFQHYKDRRPPWIKLYISLLDDYEFTHLPDAAKYHLLAIYLLASRYDNKIPYDARWIKHQISAAEEVDLPLLEMSGFIFKINELADGGDMLAARKQNATPETETETETETEVPSPPAGATPTELVKSDPKPPGENASPAQRLSWHIFEGRQALYNDQFYDPWNRKALGICKTLVEGKARGNFTEALNRLRVLFVKCATSQPGSDYWAFTPENFTLKWAQLVGDPRLRIEKPSREADARAGYEERIRALTQDAGNGPT